MLQLAWFNFTCLQASKKFVFTAPSEAAPPETSAASGADVEANSALLLKLSSQIEMLAQLVQGQSERNQSQIRSQIRSEIQSEIQIQSEIASEAANASRPSSPLPSSPLAARRANPHPHPNP